MGLSAERLRHDLEALALREPALARAIARVGIPPPRIRERGYATLLRTIIGQQVSVAAAESIWNRTAAALGGDAASVPAMVAADIDTLRGAGLSRQKIAYAKSLAELVAAGTLDLHALPGDDEDAIAALTAVKGIGRWSAEIYLLFAEGRGDVWPAGDLAVQIEVGRIMGLDARPGEKATRAIAEAWRPHRGAAAILAWHHYKSDMAVI